MPSQKASNLVYHVFPGKQGKDTKKLKIVKNFFDIFSLLNFSPEIRNFPKIRALMKGRNYSEDLVKAVVNNIKVKCADVYPDIPIDVLY